jgi:Phage tail sheath C-terminal domain
MALTSPGIEVTVIDESFYTPAEPGTVPLIVVATGKDKRNGAGTATATATTTVNAGKAFKVTSQRDLIDNYGVPFFEKTVTGTPIHGSERNEYGLLAAYSLLGVSNAAFIVRANIDLSELTGTTTAPGANPDDGDWWIDTRNTAWGIFEWNGNAATTTGGQRFATKRPIVLTSDDATKLEDSATYGRAPKSSVGSVGDYAVVFETSVEYSSTKEPARMFYKRDSALLGGDAWVLIGSNAWTASHPTVKATVTSPSVPVNQSFIINGVVVISNGTSATSLVADINGLGINGVTAARVSDRVQLYTDGTNDSAGDSALSNAIIIENGGPSPGNILTAVGIAPGTYYGPQLQMSPHTQVPEFKSDDSIPRPSGSVWIKTTEPNIGSRWRLRQWSSGTNLWTAVDAPLYATPHAAIYFIDRTGGGLNIPTNAAFVQYNFTEDFGYDSTPQTSTFRIWRRKNAGVTSITSSVVGANTFTAGGNTFTIREMVRGQLALSAPVTVTFTAAGAAVDADRMATAINALGLTQVEASVSTSNEVVIIHKTGGDIRFTDSTNLPLSKIFSPFNLGTLNGTANLYEMPAGDGGTFLASNWTPLTSSNTDFIAKASAPQNEPRDGQLWFNPSFTDVDIMVHNGTIWKGYKNQFPATDPAGPLVSASRPTTQSDGTALVNNDLWISTADSENFPTIYRWDINSLAWQLLDKTDQESDTGIVFGDARYGLSGATGNTAATIVDLLISDYLDPDAPDPALYPRGMLLWNTRRSSGNVKRYANNYINLNNDNPRQGGQSMAAYATDRWVTASGNQEDGSGTFGRLAQRQVVIQALKSVVDTSSEIRDEERRNFNLIACPGYPELYSNLVNLNLDRGVTSFVIADTPLRLRADATTLTNWSSNANGALDNGDKGLVTSDEYSALFYPNGFTTDLSGTNAVVPASHMMLRTIALSDQNSYPWFAPAGTRRGGITNATAVGFIDAGSGEFQQVALNEGQRDTLYSAKLNPIAFFNGVGHVNYGQKTRARNASALDRINVARLVVYLRSQLNKLARPYVFEPNDKITRDEVKQACDSLLLELVGLRALYDFAVVCDDSNNTPSRIDRNELYVDIAIEPVKAIEFIYIPLRIKNTGEI